MFNVLTAVFIIKLASCKCLVARSIELQLCVCETVMLIVMVMKVITTVMTK